MFQNQQQPNQQEQEEKAQRMAEMKNSILSQVLDQSARTRCESRLADKRVIHLFLSQNMCQCSHKLWKACKTWKITKKIHALMKKNGSSWKNHGIL